MRGLMPCPAAAGPRRTVTDSDAGDPPCVCCHRASREFGMSRGARPPEASQASPDPASTAATSRQASDLSGMVCMARESVPEQSSSDGRPDEWAIGWPDSAAFGFLRDRGPMRPGHRPGQSGRAHFEPPGSVRDCTRRMLRYVETYYRHRLLLTVPIAVVLLIVGGWIFVQPPSYDSTVRLWVEKQTVVPNVNDNPYLTPAQTESAALTEMLATK